MTKPTRQNAGSASFNEIATVHIELRHTDPLVWRQVEVPTSITLKVLHDIIQVVMGWFDYHFWEFTIGKQKYGLPMDDSWGTEPPIAAGKVRLHDVLKPRKTIIEYTYDFGDCWEHRLTVTDIRAGQPGDSYCLVGAHFPIEPPVARRPSFRNGRRHPLRRADDVQPGRVLCPVVASSGMAAACGRSA